MATKPELNARVAGVSIASASASDQAITTITNITGVSVSFTARAGHLYRVSGRAILSQATAGVVTLSVRESTTVIGTLAQASVADTATATVSGSCLVYSPSAGSHTYVLSLAASAGTSTVELSDDDKRAFLVVEDLGYDPTA